MKTINSHATYTQGVFDLKISLTMDITDWGLLSETYMTPVTDFAVRLLFILGSHWEPFPYSNL